MTSADAVEVPDHDLAGPLPDSTLLDLVRGGRHEAYATLYDRYSYSAHRLARHLGMRDDSEDVVAESFAQVLEQLQQGKGPHTSFRAYVFTTIRHEAARRAKARQRVVPTDDERRVDSVVPFGDHRLDAFETSAIRRAYESLPERWRTVLWHLDVEGRKPHELAGPLELSPNSVSALVYRARAGLRQAYLEQHVADTPPDSASCARTRERLPALVRRSLAMREQEQVHAHLQSCDDCMGVLLELQDTNIGVGGSARTA